MKTSKILLPADKSNNEITRIKVRKPKVLTSILVIFVLTWIILLSSCYATVRTPRQNRDGVVIEQKDRVERHDRRWRREHRDQHEIIIEGQTR